MPTPSAVEPQPAVLALFDCWLDEGATVSVQLMEAHHQWAKRQRCALFADELDAQLRFVSSLCHGADLLQWCEPDIGRFLSALPAHMESWGAHAKQANDIDTFPAWLLTQSILQLLLSPMWTGHDQLGAVLQGAQVSRGTRKHNWELVTVPFAELTKSRFQIKW